MRNSSEDKDELVKMTVYISEQTHFCIDKSIDLLGIGKQNLRKIPVLKDFTIDIEKLEDAIKEDIDNGYRPMCIVANAGTVNTGAIDPLEEVHSISRRYNLWFHIDGAYGGCSANLEITKHLFRGFNKADSVAIDLHKWLFVPFEAGCLLVKSDKHLKDTFSVIPEYQKFHDEDEKRVDFSEYSFQQSRNFKALKIWMNFKAYGTDNLKKAIEGSIYVMKHFAALVKKSKDFQLISNNLSIVCFRYIGKYNIDNLELLNQLNLEIVKQSETDSRIFIRDTKLNGMVVLRGCCTNFRREKKHVVYLLKVILEIAQKIKTCS